MEKKYKQPMLVDNRPGAGQIVGADILSKATPDGYTLLAAINPTLSYESLLNKETSINTVKDVLPFAIVAGAGLFLAIHNSVPAKTLPEFIAWVKANPGKISWGTAGAPLVEVEALRDRFGMSWVNVNYKSGAAANQALLSGEIQGYTPDVNQGAPAMKEGRVRLLAYTETRRHPALPEVPTVSESGVGANDFSLLVWLGMFAHPDVPMDILTKLNADVNEMSSAPEAVARMAPMGWRPMPSTISEVRRTTQLSNEMVSSLLAKGIKLR